jgi:CheY-like chemotaxis protein
MTMDKPRHTALVVDDNEPTRTLIARILAQELGVDCVLAGTCEEATRLASQREFDIILLDLLMPRVTGLEFLRRLRADPRTHALTVLVLSNSSREQDMEEITQLGVAGYYVKADLSLQELGERVAALLAA